jgi:hypothetical protein
VSSVKCCAEKYCQTFDWEDTVRIRRKFHSRSFATRHEIGYSVLGQLHDLLGKRKKFITLAKRDVYENAWYIIHGLSRSAFFLYKSTTTRVVIPGVRRPFGGRTGRAGKRPCPLRLI